MTNLEELSDSSNLSEDENVEEDPVVVAENAGATFRTPAGAAIARKRKLPTNKGKYKQRGSKTPVATTFMLFSEQLSSFSEQLFGILRAQSGHAYPDLACYFRERWLST